MKGITANRRFSYLLPGLLALTLASPVAAQPGGTGNLLEGCTATSRAALALAGPFCQPVTKASTGFLELTGPSHAVLYPTTDCSGPSVGVMTSASLCNVNFSNGQPVRNNIKSLYLWPQSDPALVNGTYKSNKGRILRISVQPDGRVSGSLTAAWGTSKKTLTVPIFSGLARWMTLGTTGTDLSQLGIATSNWALTLQLCAGLFTPGFQDASTCVSYTGAGHASLGSKVLSLTLHRSELRGMDMGGFDVAGELEAFQREP
ncbi:MAG TPA: hypothetical protein VN493_01010 [Thermoanaerobaculia bacterium]|nr:hypothetical protein [Thermoanaerobaculia bacterium]